jgi:hypothetical protein
MDWQRLWLATQARPWRSLALVPAGNEGPYDFTLPVAVALARTGMIHLGAQVHVADATGLALERILEFNDQLEQTMRSGAVILALPPMGASAVTVPLAKSADVALLCVLLQRTRLSDAKRTLEEIGSDRFIGAANFRWPARDAREALV